MKKCSLFIMLFLASTCFIEAKMYFVSKFITGANYYLTITEAIAATDATSTDTIKVLPGTYQEKVAIDKPLVVMGSGSNTIITTNSGDAVSISNGKLMWFKITSTGGRGVALSSRGSVSNCIAFGCKDYGFYLSGDNVSVVNCVAAENNTGFYNNYYDNSNIVNCIAYSNNVNGFEATNQNFQIGYCLSYNNTNKNYFQCKVGTGSLETDPIFLPDTDYKPDVNSPCKNAGIPGLANNDPDDTRSDIGYYGGPDAPTFPVVKRVHLIPNPDGTVKIEAIGISSY